MRAKGHIGGKRVSRSHSSVIDAAEPVVKFLQKLLFVTNIVLGKIDVHLPPTEWRMKGVIVRGGYRLQVRGTNSIQQLFVYTSEVEELKGMLCKEFEMRYVLLFE